MFVCNDMYIHIINHKLWHNSKISKRRKAEKQHAYLEFPFKNLLEIQLKIIIFDSLIYLQIKI